MSWKSKDKISYTGLYQQMVTTKISLNSINILKNSHIKANKQSAHLGWYEMVPYSLHILILCLNKYSNISYNINILITETIISNLSMYYTSMIIYIYIYNIL